MTNRGPALTGTARALVSDRPVRSLVEADDARSLVGDSASQKTTTEGYVEAVPAAARHDLADNGLVNPCMFCGSKEGRATEEHVIPKWARNALGAHPVTLHMSDGPDSERREVLKMQHLNIVLKRVICERCNNEWLAGVENDVKPYLSPMMVDAQRISLTPEQQAVLALWAVKTTWLYELAARQKHGKGRLIEGYRASDVELAWLRTKRMPPPRAMVWLGCWDCEKSVPVNYEPSQAPLPTVDGSELNGHLTTISLGYVVFQVFTVNFVIAELKNAPVWNQRPPAPLDEALIRIWPPSLTPRATPWPPPAFSKADWRRLVTWDECLRSGD